MSRSINLPALWRGLTAQSRAVPALPASGITRRVWLGWGLTSFPSVIFSHCATVLLMQFMIDSLAITAGTAAALFAVVKLWDAVIDPSAGLISDRVVARYGSRVCCVLVGGVMASLILIGMFRVPVLGARALEIYLLFSLLLYVTACSIFKVSYVAMAAEIASGYHERTQLMTARVAFAGLGTLVGLGVSPMLLEIWGTDRAGYAQLATTLALLCAAIVLASCWMLRGSRSPRSCGRGGHSLLKQLLHVIRDRPFLWLAVVKFTYFFTLAMTIAALGFFTRHVVQLPEFWLGILLALHCVGSLISLPLWASLARQYGKRGAFMAASALCAVGWISWFFSHPGESTSMLCLRALFIGLSSGGTFLLSQSMLPDTVEYESRRIGSPRSGGITGILMMVEQVGWAGGIVALGMLLSVSGYIESDGKTVLQPDSALAAIRVALSIIPGAMQLLAIFAISRYELTETALRRVSLAAECSSSFVPAAMRRNHSN